jgi:hypothetical protein
MALRDRPKRIDFPVPKDDEILKAGTHRGVIYVPSTTDMSKPISAKEHQKRVRMVSKEISRIFGGDTVQRQAFGNWLDEKGKLVGERITRIEFFTTPSNYRKNDYKIGKMIHNLAKKWGQWAISYEYQSPKQSRALYFVRPVERKKLDRMV